MDSVPTLICLVFLWTLHICRTFAEPPSFLLRGRESEDIFRRLVCEGTGNVKITNKMHQCAEQLKEQQQVEFRKKLLRIAKEECDSRIMVPHKRPGEQKFPVNNKYPVNSQEKTLVKKKQQPNDGAPGHVRHQHPKQGTPAPKDKKKTRRKMISESGAMSEEMRRFLLEAGMDPAVEETDFKLEITSTKEKSHPVQLKQALEQHSMKKPQQGEENSKSHTRRPEPSHPVQLKQALVPHSRKKPQQGEENSKSHTRRPEPKNYVNTNYRAIPIGVAPPNTEPVLTRVPKPPTAIPNYVANTLKQLVSGYYGAGDKALKGLGIDADALRKIAAQVSTKHTKNKGLAHASTTNTNNSVVANAVVIGGEISNSIVSNGGTSVSFGIDEFGHSPVIKDKPGKTASVESSIDFKLEAPIAAQPSKGKNVIQPATGSKAEKEPKTTILYESAPISVTKKFVSKSGFLDDGMKNFLLQAGMDPKTNEADIKFEITSVKRKMLSEKEKNKAVFSEPVNVEILPEMDDFSSDLMDFKSLRNSRPRTAKKRRRPSPRPRFRRPVIRESLTPNVSRFETFDSNSDFLPPDVTEGLKEIFLNNGPPSSYAHSYRGRVKHPQQLQRRKREHNLSKRHMRDKLKRMRQLLTNQLMVMKMDQFEACLKGIVSTG